jgi:hypothetical protein
LNDRTRIEFALTRIRGRSVCPVVGIEPAAAVTTAIVSPTRAISAAATSIAERMPSAGASMSNDALSDSTTAIASPR